MPSGVVAPHTSHLLVFRVIQNENHLRRLRRFYFDLFVDP